MMPLLVGSIDESCIFLLDENFALQEKIGLSQGFSLTKEGTGKINLIAVTHYAASERI